MPTVKKILKSRFAQAVAAFLLAAYIRLVYATSRKVRHVDAASERYMRGDDNAIFAFWHGRMMLLPAFCPPKRKMRVLISRHRDGALISRVIAHFGQATVSGSSSRGGQAAASEIVRVLEDGDNISITPDGPRGPAQVVGGGIVSLARITGRPILPVTFASTREKRLGSWDRFALAGPFGRIEFHVGPPIAVPAGIGEAQEEAWRLFVEQAMNEGVAFAERRAHG